MRGDINIYKNLTIEDIEKTLIELSESKVNKRKFFITTGKQGVIEYLKLLYEKTGLPKEDIKIKLDKAKKELREGFYTISEEGITYYKTN